MSFLGRTFFRKEIARHDNTVVNPRESYTEESNKTVAIPLAVALKEILNIDCQIIEVYYEFLIGLKFQLMGMREQD